MSPIHLDRLLRFFHEAGELKNLMRTGWTRYEIPRPESVADHTYRMVLMAMALGARAGLDTLRLIMLCVVHDLPEALTGDITPHDGVSDEEKHKREEKALRDLVQDIPDGDAYIELWMEYEAQETPEARMAYQIDKLEMAIQAREYQKAYPENDLSEFIDNVEAVITIPELRSLFDSLNTAS